MKRCTKCGGTKPLEEFYKSSLSKDGRAWRCRECSKAAHRGWYADNIEQAKHDSRKWIKNNPERAKETHRLYYVAHREKTLAAQRKLWIANHHNLRKEFGRLCLDCGLEFPMGMFEYHHLDPSAKTEHANLRCWRWERIKIYVRGCVQLCPNCHRLRHRNEWDAVWKELEAAK